MEIKFLFPFVVTILLSAVIGCTNYRTGSSRLQTTSVAQDKATMEALATTIKKEQEQETEEPPPATSIVSPPKVDPSLTPTTLIQNPGFEQGLVGWSSTGGTASYMIDNTTSINGSYSVKGTEQSEPNLGRLYQDVTKKLEVGRKYKISGWIKTQNVTGQVVIGLDYAGSDGWTPSDGYVQEIGHVTGTTDWTHYESAPFALLPMPQDTARLLFLIDFNVGSGTAWWDNVELVPAEAKLNYPPNIPSHPTPADNSILESFNINLSWIGGDPDGDTVTYDVYVEANDSRLNDPVSRSQYDTTFDPGTLSSDTHYYWRVVAKDEEGLTSFGPIWDFYTRSKVVATSTPIPPLSKHRPLIAFTSYRDRNAEIYAMNADGTNQQRVTTNPAPDDNPTWSPDGRIIAFQSRRIRTHDIYLVGRDGSDLKRFTGDAAADDILPAWSPDGKKIAFVSARDGNEEIYIIDRDGTNLTNLTNHPAGDWRVAWSPNSRELVFTSTRDGDNDIYLINVDGSNLRKLTDNLSDDRDPAWSPDGHWIAFLSNRDGNFEIYKMRPDGRSHTRLTFNPADDRHPNWSPDSRWIVFTSNRDGDDGDFDIYAVNVDGSHLTRLTDNPADDMAPVWSR